MTTIGMRFDTVEFDVVDHVATITINRPEKLNTFTAKMLTEFETIWRHVAETDEIHCVVLRAAPGRAFSTGSDLKASAEPGGSLFHSNLWTKVDPGERLGPKSNECWKPVVCAVHGMAAGGAFYWINEADIIICSEDATFFDPHVTYGMASALEPIGATYRMPLGDVLRMVLLGNDERISATTAFRMGLVSEITESDKLWTRAAELAAKIAAKPPAAVQGSVRAIWESLDMGRTIALKTSLKYCFLANPIGQSQVDREALMGGAKQFEVR